MLTTAILVHYSLLLIVSADRISLQLCAFSTSYSYEHNNRDTLGSTPPSAGPCRHLHLKSTLYPLDNVRLAYLPCSISSNAGRNIVMHDMVHALAHYTHRRVTIGRFRSAHLLCVTPGSLELEVVLLAAGNNMPKAPVSTSILLLCATVFALWIDSGS